MLQHVSSPPSPEPVCDFASAAGGCILSVAVVRNRSLDIRSLQGTRSCHSGVRWTAGWSLPLGFLLSRNYLSWSKEQPLSQGIVWKCPLFYFLCSLSRLTGSLVKQTSVPSSVPAVFLELQPWHLLCALSVKARNLTFARRITTVKHPTVSPTTTAREPSGQPLPKIDKDVSLLYFYCLITVKTCKHFSCFLFHSVTGVSGMEQGMLHLWTI